MPASEWATTTTRSSQVQASTAPPAAMPIPRTVSEGDGAFRPDRDPAFRARADSAFRANDESAVRARVDSALRAREPALPRDGEPVLAREAAPAPAADAAAVLRSEGDPRSSPLRIPCLPATSRAPSR